MRTFRCALRGFLGAGMKTLSNRKDSFARRMIQQKLMADPSFPLTYAINLCIPAGHGDVEVPWWTYGAGGMQLWFPSSLEEPLSPTTRNSMAAHTPDPELEFDREVYPIGISIAEVAIIGSPLHCSTCTCCLLDVWLQERT